MRDVMHHLATKGCKAHASPALLATPTITGRCDLAEINLRFSTPAGTETSDEPQIGSMRVHAINAFGTQLIRSGLAAVTPFVVIAVPAIAFALRRQRDH